VKNHWRTDEILDYKYSEETREIHFKTYHSSPYCLLQDRHVNMPYQNWRMAPRQMMNCCMFTIESGSFELNIEIKVGGLKIKLSTFFGLGHFCFLEDKLRQNI
jgi:hypothetical protein